MSRAVVMLALLVMVARPAAEPSQVRDAVAPPTVPGTASIAGVVVTDDADLRPVHRANVTVASGGLGLPQTVVTDDAGAFLISALAAGNYTIEADKAAYVPAFYGAKSGGLLPGVPIAVVDHQRVTGIELRMAHGAVVTGTLRFTDGRPATGVNVQISSIETVNGERKPSLEGHSATTDDRGIYRVFGLPAGDYLVMARPGPVYMAMLGMGDTRQVSPEEIQWAEQAVAAAPGTAATPLAPAPPPGRGVAFAPVYYPGSADASNATVVTVAAAEERAGVDFTVAPVPTATVSGQIYGLDGAPAAGASVSLSPVAGDTDLVGAILGRLGGRPSADGAFALTGVTPGRYRVMARAESPSAEKEKPKDAADPFQMLGALMPGGGATATLWGEEEVSVNGQDVAGIAIRLQNGLSIAGRVVVERTGSGPAPDLTQVRVALSTPPTGSSQNDMMTAMMTGASASVAADGAFVFKGLTPDRYRLSAGAGGIRNLLAMFQPNAADPEPSGGLMLKSAMWQGQDLADTPVDLKTGSDVSGVVVTLTDRQTRISGTVRDGVGRSTPSFPIVAFSTDRAMWFPTSRRVQQARVLSDGTFTITGLPAGEYYVAALTELKTDELSDPSFLDSVARAALRIVIADGEHKTLNVRLAGGLQ